MIERLDLEWNRTDRLINRREAVSSSGDPYEKRAVNRSYDGSDCSELALVINAEHGVGEAKETSHDEAS